MNRERASKQASTDEQQRQKHREKNERRADVGCQKRPNERTNIECSLYIRKNTIDFKSKLQTFAVSKCRERAK